MLFFRWEGMKEVNGKLEKILIHPYLLKEK